MSNPADPNNCSKVSSSKLRFRAIRDDGLNRFYAREVVGELLTDQLYGLDPHKIVDLGAGQGFVSVAVGRRWNKAEMVTIDIDPKCIAGVHLNIRKSGTLKHTHYIHDILDVDMPAALIQNGKFDLAICTPPFYRPKWRPDFTKILQYADMIDACPPRTYITAEMLFLAQALRLVKSGGTIAFVIPDGMLTGWRTEPLRRYLLYKHRIDCVLQLPQHAFHNTQARCFILIFTKHAQPIEDIKLLRYDACDGLLNPLFIKFDIAEKRLDYAYHASLKHKSERIITLRQLGADIKRGSLNIAEARKASFPVFHTTDFRSKGSELYLATGTSDAIDPKLIIAEPGDILLARVDCNLHQKVAKIATGKIVLTDSVYRIRLPAHLQIIAFEALRSTTGSARLLAVSKGVTARFLSKIDLLDLPLDAKGKYPL